MRNSTIREMSNRTRIALTFLGLFLILLISFHTAHADDSYRDRNHIADRQSPTLDLKTPGKEIIAFESSTKVESFFPPRRRLDSLLRTPLEIHTAQTRKNGHTATIINITGLNPSTDISDLVFRWDLASGAVQRETALPVLVHEFSEAGRYPLRIDILLHKRVIRTLSDYIDVPLTDSPSSVYSIWPYQIDSTDNSILIDGHIRESIWHNAATITQFKTLAQRKNPASRTTVKVMSDSDTLYFAFICFDQYPGDIRSAQTLRDTSFGFDDRVSVEIETFINTGRLSVFTVNSLGTQGDTRMQGRAGKIEWKGDWKAAATRTSTGWSAEMAIPLNILNFDSNTNEFGINFSRYQNRTRQWSSWAEAKYRGSKISSARLLGLDLRNSGLSKRWSFQAYQLANTSGQNFSGDEDRLYAYAGITLRYEPQSNLTALLDLFPDFTQLESQFASIDFNYNETSVTETRPFFNEGSALFELDKNLFYSQRIPDMYGGIKLFAQLDQESLGGFLTLSPDSRGDGMFLYKNSYFQDHWTEVSGIATQGDEVDNRVFSGKLSGQFSSGFYYSTLFAHNNTSGNEELNGVLSKSTTAWKNEHFDIGLRYADYDIAFQPVLGLIDRDLPGTYGGELFFSYDRDDRSSRLTSISYNLNFERRMINRNNKQIEGIYADSVFTIDNRVSISPSWYRADYRPVESSPGEFSSRLNDDTYGALSVDFNQDSTQFGYGFYIADGKLGGGSYRYQSGYLWLQPFSSAYLSLAHSQLDSFGALNQLTVDFDYTFNARNAIFSRYYKSGDAEYYRLSYRRLVASGVDVFAVIEKSGSQKISASAKVVWAI